MESVWFSSKLSEEIITNDGIYDSMQSIIADLSIYRINITKIAENLEGVLTHKEPEKREKGMMFFSQLLKQMPTNLLNDIELKFIAKFYADRLKDNHRVIPSVLSGFLTLIEMENFRMQYCQEFFLLLFREVPCQSQVRQDRFHIFEIIRKLFEKDVDYLKSLGPDFVYGVISAIDGERDPRNLLHLFKFLPKFISQIPLGHLTEEMFEIISCYYPIDFHPAPDDPAAVSRQELADALCPCLCAIPEFAEHCLVLLIEKLDSNLRLAKLDSLQLLTTSCKTFKAESYAPFLKALWASLQREISNKTDEEIKAAAHSALSALITILASTVNTDQAFEGFVKGILLSMQKNIAEATTALHFGQAAKVLLTTASASKESCFIIAGTMIPATIAFYEFKTSSRLQISSLQFLGELYKVAKFWNILLLISNQVKSIPQHCLNAISVPKKEFQIAGLKLLTIVIDELQTDLVVPLSDILIHNVQTSIDSDLLEVSVETVHAIARKYPELIMSVVVKGKCDLDNLVSDKGTMLKRLNLLCNLASIDEFTKVIIEEMLKVVMDEDEQTSKSAGIVVEALRESMSNSSFYTKQKVAQIESDHGLIAAVMAWVTREIETIPVDSLSPGFQLISNTMSSLPPEMQQAMLTEYAPNVISLCRNNEVYFFLIEGLYTSLHNSVYDDSFEPLMSLLLKLSLKTSNEVLRTKAFALIAHFLNKAEFGPKFETLYDILKQFLSSCDKTDQALCLRLILLYGWITKALVIRGCDMFMFWLQKITVVLSTPDYSQFGAESIRLIMSDSVDYLTTKQHCRISLLYRQRMYQAFSDIYQSMTKNDDCKESLLLSWAYILAKTPRSLLKNDIGKVAPLVIDSLEIDNKELLIVMLEILISFVQTDATVSSSLQTILPRLVSLSTYVKSMDVRIKSLQCLFEIANTYRTVLLLPYKQDILIDLSPALDDQKRLVRNMAVKARTRWFLIGAPGETTQN